MFNQNCGNCHDQTFQPIMRLFGLPNTFSVSDATCNHCHQGAIHNTKQAHAAACASCHREHQGHEILATHVADRHCTNCHSNLANHLKAGTTTAFHTSITNFQDHPEFRPSLKGKKDEAKIKFNHKAHLDLDLDALKSANEKAGREELKGFGAKMVCADCHQMDDERKYLKPINYEQHCVRCHALNAVLIGDFVKDLKTAAAALSKTPLPHKEPAIIRAVLRDRLVEFAQANAVVVGKGAPSVPRPLPWRPVTEEQWLWAKDQAKKTEELLFMNRQWQKAEPMPACSHCHIEVLFASGASGQRVPVYQKTSIPSRWYNHSIFNHGSHRVTDCVDCHDRNAAGVKVADSQSTEDILLPTLRSCRECHTGSGGARNTCVECHRYHQR